MGFPCEEARHFGGLLLLRAVHNWHRTLVEQHSHADVAFDEHQSLIFTSVLDVVDCDRLLNLVGGASEVHDAHL